MGEEFEDDFSVCLSVCLDLLVVVAVDGSCNRLSIICVSLSLSGRKTPTYLLTVSVCLSLFSSLCHAFVFVCLFVLVPPPSLSRCC